MARGNDAKVEEVTDRVETLVQICQAVTARRLHTLEAVRQFINDLFADDVAGVLTLATYHRSKGREWGRVYLWEHSKRCPSRAARLPWQQEQERNLAYVAITRVKETLGYVN
jgi:superfamily I DNA/RNA helicase